MRRIVLAVATSALAIPATASAAISHVYAQTGNPVLCVEDTTVSQLTFQVKDSTGQLIEAASAAPVSSACPGGSGTTSFVPTLKTGYPRFPYGATVTVLGDGAPIDVPMPVAAWDALTNVTRLKNILAGSTVTGEGVNTTVNSDGTLMISSTSNDNLTIGETLSGGVPYTAVMGPEQFGVTAETIRNAAGVSVSGLDPTGARGTATLRSPSGKLLATAPLDARVGADEVASASLNGYIAGSGDTITVSQPNWFSHTIRAASASLVRNGFNVSVPAGGGETATYAPSSADGSTINNGLPRFTFEKTSDPALACEQLGPAVPCLPGTLARYSVAARGFFPVAGDSLQVVTNDPVGDSVTYTVVQKGGWGSLDDGNIAFSGPVGAEGVARITSANTRLVRRLRVTPTGFTPDNSIGGEPFAVHVGNGARITFSGSAFAGFAPYTFRLSYKIRYTNGGPGVVSGVTYPHAEVLVIHSETALTAILPTVANGRGRFSVRVPDVRRGDLLDVAAVQPGGHGNWITTTSAAGALHPSIHGPADRATVSGTVRYTVTGGGSSPTWTLYRRGGGHLPLGHGRSYTINTSKLANGVYRLEVQGTGKSMIDYRYLIVHH